MLLTYDAVDENGLRASDQFEAPNVQEAIAQLRAQGLFVTHIQEVEARLSRKSAHQARLGPARLPLKVLVLFTRQMSMLLRAGSGLVPAMDAIRRQMKRPQHAALLSRIISDLEQGSTLTEALRKHPRTFDPVFCAIISAGEASAALTEMFERLATIVGARRTMRNKVIGALAYPALLILMAMKIFLALLFFVLPRFSEMFTQLQVEIPTTTQYMLSFADALKSYWWAFLGGILACVGGIVWVIRSATGRQWLADIQTGVPFLGTLRSRLIQGQVFRTMGMLLESRVGVLDTLELVRESTSNKRFQRLFDDMERAITGGGQLSTAIEGSGLVPAYICQAVRTGEESGNLGGALSYCADMLDETNAEIIQATTKLIEPLILIVLGLVVGTVAVSLFMPLFDMTSAIQ